MSTQNEPTSKGFAGLSGLVDQAKPNFDSSPAQPVASEAPARVPAQNDAAQKAPSRSQSRLPPPRDEPIPPAASSSKWGGIVLGFLFGGIIVGGLVLSANGPKVEPSQSVVGDYPPASSFDPSTANPTTDVDAAQAAADVAAAAADAAASSGNSSSDSGWTITEVPTSAGDSDAAAAAAAAGDIAAAAADAAAAAADAATANAAEVVANSSEGIDRASIEPVGDYAETPPPFGFGQVLSGTQIRYCVRERVRIDAADAVVDNTVEWQVNRFNELVDDYNSRCSSFRYPVGLMQRIEAETQQIRPTLEAEGRARIQ